MKAFISGRLELFFDRASENEKHEFAKALAIDDRKKMSELTKKYEAEGRKMDIDRDKINWAGLLIESIFVALFWSSPILLFAVICSQNGGNF